MFVVQRTFGRVRRGYDPDEVDRHLELVSQWFTSTDAGRAVAEARGTLKEREAELREMLEAARKEAAATVEGARLEAEATLEGARRRADADAREAERLLAEAREELSAARAEAAAADVIRDAEARAAELVETARSEAEQIVAEARAATEQELASARRAGEQLLAAMRAEGAAAAEATRAEADADAARVRAEADAEAAAVRADAAREAEEMRAAAVADAERARTAAATDAERTRAESAAAAKAAEAELTAYVERRRREADRVTIGTGTKPSLSASPPGFPSTLLFGRLQPAGRRGQDVPYALRVPRDGEPDQHRDVHRVDDQGEREHDQRTAAQVVAQERELDEPCRDHVCEQRPLRDADEARPVEALDPAQRDQVPCEQRRRRRQQHDGRGERHVLGKVRGEVDAAGDDQRERCHADLRHGGKALVAHPDATLVMITNVAICITPVAPAV
jgi:DivIVA domain-containing protein